MNRLNELRQNLSTTKKVFKRGTQRAAASDEAFNQPTSPHLSSQIMKDSHQSVMGYQARNKFNISRIGGLGSINTMIDSKGSNPQNTLTDDAAAITQSQTASAAFNFGTS